MKSAYEVITHHKSIRSYKDEPVKQEDLDMILNAAIHGPSSINGQQWSMVVVKDKAKREKLVELTGGQPWIGEAPVFIFFVGDYRRAADTMKNKGVEFKNMESIEATMVASVDVGIAFSNAMTTAESLGYGIVPIGAIRRAPQDIIDMLNLPEYVYPILGMCIGVSNDDDETLKPRMPKSMMVHEETYRRASLEEIEDYDKQVREYMDKRTEGKEIRSWSDTTGGVYANVYFPLVKETLEKQGFTNKK